MIIFMYFFIAKLDVPARGENKYSLLSIFSAFRSSTGTRQRSIHMEYLPESNSVLKLELTENDLPRKITRSNFTIGEFMKKRFRITVHQGSFEDILINVQTIKLRPDKMKLWSNNKDTLVSFLGPNHVRDNCD